MSSPPRSPAADSDSWFKPAGVALGILVLIAGFKTFSVAAGAPPGESTHQYFVTGLIELGGAAGLIAMALGWFDAAWPAGAAKASVFYGVAAVVGVAIALFIRRCGMHQIGGFDHSVLVDAAWRLYNGQTAYVDFPCTLPVAFILGAKFAFQWFGVAWRSFVDMTAVFAVVTFVWSLLLLVELFGRRWTTLLWAFALQAISTMLASFWWYNPVTAVTATLYLLAAVVWLHRPGALGAAVSYGLALLAVATIKPNVAGVILPLVSSVLLLNSRLRWKTLLLSAAALAAFLLLLAINHLSFTGMLHGYLSVASRGASLKQFLQDLSPVAKRAALMALAIVVLPLPVALYQGRRALRSPRPYIPLIALAGGLYGYITNGEQKLIDMPLLLFGAILLVAELYSASIPERGPVFSLPARWNRCLCLVCVILASGGIAQGLGRDRIKSTGPMQFFEYDDSKHLIENGFFKGLHSGDCFFEINRELAYVLGQEKSSTVWIGPRMQWAYAAYGKPSPRRLPIWWHPGVAFAPADEDTYFNRFLDSRFDVLIFFKDDFAYFTRDRIQHLLEHYTVDESYPLLTIMRLKKGPS